jgi:hypothetical protein
MLASGFFGNLMTILVERVQVTNYDGLFLRHSNLLTP